MDGLLKLYKHRILTHAGMIDVKTAEIKAMEEYKKYKELHWDDVFKSEKGYIKVLEDIEIN